MNALFREGSKSCRRFGGHPVKPFALVRKRMRSLFCVDSCYCGWRASIPPPVLHRSPPRAGFVVFGKAQGAPNKGTTSKGAAHVARFTSCPLPPWGFPVPRCLAGCLGPSHRTEGNPPQSRHQRTGGGALGGLWVVGENHPPRPLTFQCHGIQSRRHCSRKYSGSVEHHRQHIVIRAIALLYETWGDSLAAFLHDAPGALHFLLALLL